MIMLYGAFSIQPAGDIVPVANAGGKDSDFCKSKLDSPPHRVSPIREFSLVYASCARQDLNLQLTGSKRRAAKRDEP
jgi:hypothetical protein